MLYDIVWLVEMVFWVALACEFAIVNLVLCGETELFFIRTLLASLLPIRFFDLMLLEEAIRFLLFRLFSCRLCVRFVFKFCLCWSS